MKTLEILCSSTGASFAGPFGIDMNTFNPVAAGCAAVPGQPARYECHPNTIPGAIPPFESYGAVWSQGIGLCHFTAIVPNPNGRTITNEYEEKISSVMSALISNYGDRYSSANAPADIGSWWIDVMFSWRTDPSNGFTDIIVNYYDRMDANYPSLQPFDAGLQVSYRRIIFTDCIMEAARELNRIENSLHAPNESLTNGL